MQKHDTSKKQNPHLVKLHVEWSFIQQLGNSDTVVTGDTFSFCLKILPVHFLEKISNTMKMSQNLA